MSPLFVSVIDCFKIKLGFFRTIGWANREPLSLGNVSDAAMKSILTAYCFCRKVIIA